jgi:hypothetical protein
MVVVCIGNAGMGSSSLKQDVVMIRTRKIYKKNLFMLIFVENI